MSRLINISGTTPVIDPEYRYKMPTILCKIEGKGNGTKTIILNLVQLGESLHRDPGEVIKFFSYELGTQCNMNGKSGLSVINGLHENHVLQGLVHNYIEMFVLCPHCRLPETEYKIKNEKIWHRCAACGAKESMDMAHKLSGYVLKSQGVVKTTKEKKKRKNEGKEKEDGKGFLKI